MAEISSLPGHVAFIMDGNGRWAKKRLMPRSFGHRQGAKNVIEIVEHAFNLGIKAVSLYAFSTENWSRPQEEIDALFDIFRKYFLDNLNKMLKDGVKLMVMGDIQSLPPDIKKSIDECVDKTKHNTKNILNIGINYGSRFEITAAVNKLIKSGVTEVTEESFKNYLYTAGLGDPDLIIRTSGECRLSNFMLYQSAYSELYFTKTLWPDFGKKNLEKALKEYAGRVRKFGK